MSHLPCAKPAPVPGTAHRTHQDSWDQDDARDCGAEWPIIAGYLSQRRHKSCCGLVASTLSPFQEVRFPSNKMTFRNIYCVQFDWNLHAKFLKPTIGDQGLATRPFTDTATEILLFLWKYSYKHIKHFYLPKYPMSEAFRWHSNFDIRAWKKIWLKNPL